MTLKSLLVSAAFTVAFAVPGFAGVDDIIKERQTCMKTQAGNVFGMMFPMLKGEKPYDAAMVADGFAKMGAACANWATYWSDEAKGGTIPHRSKDEAWTDRAGLEAASAASYTALQALKATTDEASFKAALPAVGAGCQGCHEKFQAPKL